MIELLLDLLRARGRFHFRVWTVIFLLVSLQMTTALRPILGTSRQWFPREKKFFLEYWGENIFSHNPGDRAKIQQVQ